MASGGREWSPRLLSASIAASGVESIGCAS
jgi:hypothetical protein